MRPLDSVQRALVSKTTIVKPDKRYDEITKIVHQRNFHSDPYLKALNIKVDTNEMLKINGEYIDCSSISFLFRIFSTYFATTSSEVSWPR